MARSLDTKRLIVLCAAILLIAVSAWITAFEFFKDSDSWYEARSLVLANRQYPMPADSNVSPQLSGFSYRFSGDYEAFKLNVHCKGSTIDQYFHVEFERQNGRLQLLRMIRD